MIGLVEFLRARLDEAEEDARRGYLKVLEDPTYGGWNKATTAGLPPLVAGQVLVEIRAKRQVVDLHRQIEDAQEMQDFCSTCDVTGEYPEYPCATLRLLALPYAAHLDYREEWKP
ncbi:DUF6221 family protein [Streptomyces sp. NPDC088736]|uniref:DUF6221 family protein n=1 Tax=Streptomyces sp. NPDC088736 TaxID=3365881 RepID=UPI003816E447